MKGHIEQRGENSWRISIYLGKDHLGKKRFARETVRGTEEDAQMRLAALVIEVGRGRYSSPSKMTVAEFLDRWLEDYCRVSVRQSTYDMYEMLVRVHIAPEIGHVRLDKIAPLDIQGFIRRKTRGARADGKTGTLSPKTVKHIYSVLRAAFNRAVKWGLLPHSPVGAVDAPRCEKHSVSVWTDDEVRRFLAAAAGERLYAAYLLALGTGLRRGEILGLRWEDIDLARGMLSVRRSLVPTSQGNLLQEPKTAGSRRHVKMSPDLTDALVAHRSKQQEEKDLFQEAYNDLGLVFPSYTGTPLDPRNLARAFEKVIAVAGVPKISFHDLRHTHATMLLQAGVHPKVVAERLGHTEIGTTLDTYSHVLPSMQEEAALVIDRVVGNPVGNPTGIGNPDLVH